MDVRAEKDGMDVVNIITPVERSRIAKALRRATDLGIDHKSLEVTGLEGRQLPSSSSAAPEGDASRGRLSDVQPGLPKIGVEGAEINGPARPAAPGSAPGAGKPVNVPEALNAPAKALGPNETAEPRVTISPPQAPVTGLEGRTLPSSSSAAPKGDASRGLRLSDGQPDPQKIGVEGAEINEPQRSAAVLARITPSPENKAGVHFGTLLRIVGHQL